MPCDKIKQVVEDIREADLILVGIGEEMDLHRQLRSDERYLKLSETINEKWLLPYVEKVMLNEMGQEKREIYAELERCLKNKNYFIVSLCRDGVIADTGLIKDRIVEPCGAYKKLQCVEGCSKDLYEIPGKLLAQVETGLSDGNFPGEIERPVCPHCGKALVFNNIDAVPYVEEGYLDKWSIYQKWLQGSLNKKLCILELGVGMKYPTVVRWPFEKIAFFNLKATLYRVHSRLYQTTEELKERSYGICQRPEEFLKELSNGF